MTPTVHLDREVSLKLKIEVSSQNGYVTISGVTEPIIGQRETRPGIQLQDGEPCILAGILTKQDNTTDQRNPRPRRDSASQILLRLQYIKRTQQDEIVFLLIPHIVRESVLTRLNTRAIDTGTSQRLSSSAATTSPCDDVASRHLSRTPPPASNTTAANAAAAMVQQMNQQALPPIAAACQSRHRLMPAVAQRRPRTARASAAGLHRRQPRRSSPPTRPRPSAAPSRSPIMLSNAHDVFSVPLQLQFDPKVLQLVNVDAGGLLGRDGQPVALVHRDDGNGLVTISASRPPGSHGVTGREGLHSHLQGDRRGRLQARAREGGAQNQRTKEQPSGRR